MDRVTETDYWNANLYDEKHLFVSQFGEDLVELLAPKKDEDILDIGCGTGDITKTISEFGTKVKGIDKSKNMIYQARKKYPNIEFHVEDATELNYNIEFDAVFSNATLHWVKPPKKALSCVYDSLKEGGRFVAEFGGKGNVGQLTAEIINQLRRLGFPYKEGRFPWFFPSIGEYTALMEEVGFKVTFANLFDRPTPLEGDNGIKNWIDMFGKTIVEGLDKDTIDLLVTHVENNLRKTMFRENKWIADYKRIRVIGIKG